MADSSKLRSYQYNDSYGSEPASDAANASHNDPLAELARLIGQHDPFADFPRDTAVEPTHGGGQAHEFEPPGSAEWRADSHGHETGRHHGGYATADYRPGEAERFDAAAEDPYRIAPQAQYREPYDQAPYPAGTGEPPPAYLAADLRGSFPGEPPAADLHHEDQSGQPRYAQDDHQSNYAQAMHADAPASHDPAAYAAAHLQQAGYDTGAQAGGSGIAEDYYAAGIAAPDHGSYEEAPRKRRGLGTVAAVLGLAVLGTAGAFGYRAIFSGGSAGSKPPPVIRADTSPAKMVPPPQSADSHKPIQDRVGERGQAERVVPREEPPLNMQEATKQSPPRPVFPGAPNSPGATAGSASPFAGSAMAATAPPNPGSEPKKIRTVTIRPEQTEAGRLPSGTPPQASPTRTANASTALPGGEARPVQRPAPAPMANAPLPLAPQSPADPAPARPRTAVAAPASGPTGGYALQLSSSRTEAEAQATARTAKARYGSVLGDRTSFVRKIDLGDKGTYYRTMFGGFSSADQATEACNQLKAAGRDCVVQRN